MVICGGEVVVVAEHNVAAMDDVVAIVDVAAANDVAVVVDVAAVDGVVVAVGDAAVVVVWVQQCWIRACTSL